MGTDGYHGQNSMSKLPFAAGCALGLACGAAAMSVLYRQPDASIQMAPGTEFGVVADEVMTLTYRSEAVTVTAQRSKPSDRFAVQATFVNGSLAQQCVVSPDLAGRLATISTITVKRQLPLGKLGADFPRLIGHLEIRSGMLDDGGTSIELRKSADGKVLVARYAGAVLEILNPVKPFEELAGGCSALAK